MKINVTHAQSTMLSSECNINVSVLLPTRGRGDLAGKSLYTLIDLATDNSKIEYLVIVDEDDTDTIEHFKEVIVPAANEQNLKLAMVISKPFGYINLHQYLNILASQSSGEWLMFWNDDAIMKTKGWDTKIAENTGEFKVLRMQENSQHPYAIFPIVPRDWYYLLGHLSDHQMTDAQISQIGYMCNIVKNIDVHCIHDRFDLTGNNNDTTYKNRPQLEGNPSNPHDLNSDETLNRRYAQCFKIMWYLRKIGQYNDHFEQSVGKGKNMWKYLVENDPLDLTKQYNI